MSTKTHFIAFLSILALIPCAPAFCPFYTSAPGDTNGDCKQNILDVQTVIADLLNSPGAGEASDVNGDGQVDVRDFQKVLFWASQSEEESQAPPRESVPKSPRLAGYPTLLLARPGASKFQVVLAEKDNTRRAPRDSFEWTCPSETERFLYILTPHAPPCSLTV
jgi:hypothetical protein